MFEQFTAQNYFFPQNIPPKGAGAPVLEGDHFNFPFQDFAGMNTQSDRTAINDTQFGWLENIIPIGRANLQAIPGPGPNLAKIPDGYGNLSHGIEGQIGATGYQFWLTDTGALFSFNVGTPGFTLIAAAGTFSNTGVDMTMWGTQYLLLVDPNKGYFIYDGNFLYTKGNVFAFTVTAGGSGYTSTPNVSVSGGSGAGAAGVATVSGGAVTAITVTNIGTGYQPGDTLTVSITGGGGSSATATLSVMQWNPFGAPLAVGLPYIAVGFGRAVIIANRNIIASVGGNPNDFALADGGGFFPVNDEYHLGPLTHIFAGNSYLYVRSASAVDTISAITSTTANNSTTTTISRNNLSTNLGSVYDQVDTIFLRSYVTANQYGAYAFAGMVPEKISDDMDGIWPNIDFTQNFVTGQCQIFNKLVFYVFCTFKDPVLGSRPVFLVNLQGKWLVSSQKTNIKFAVTSQYNGQSIVYATDGKNLFQCFVNQTEGIPWRISTKLYDFGQPLSDKEGMRLALYVDTNNIASLKMIEESEFNQYTPQYYLLQWMNNSGQEIQFINQNNSILSWINSNAASVQNPYITVANPIYFTGSGGNPINWTGTGPIQFVGTGFYEQFAPMTTKTKYLGATFLGATPALQVVVLGFQYDIASLMTTP